MFEFAFYNRADAESGLLLFKELEANRLASRMHSRRIAELHRKHFELSTQLAEDDVANTEDARETKSRLASFAERIESWKLGAASSGAISIGSLAVAALSNTSAFRAPFSAPVSLLVAEAAVVLTTGAASVASAVKANRLESEKGDAEAQHVGRRSKRSGVDQSKELLTINRELESERVKQEKPDREIDQALQALKKLGMDVPESWQQADPIADFLHSRQVKTARASIEHWLGQGAEIPSPRKGLGLSGL